MIIPKDKINTIINVKNNYNNLEKAPSELKNCLEKQVKRIKENSNNYERSLEVGIAIGFLLSIEILLDSCGQHNNILVLNYLTDTFENLPFDDEEDFKLAVCSYLKARKALV